MKILIVSTYDIQGGAGRAAFRLHQALLDHQVNSQMLVQEKTSDNFTVIGPSSDSEKALSKLNSYLNKIPVKKYKNRSKVLFSNSNRINIISVVDKINNFDADIVHLHWTSHGMLSIEDISKINAPIVWSLHDMYAFTGGCHYDEDCNLYKASCGTCKVLRSSDIADISFKLLKRKAKSYNSIKSLTVVCLSNWMENCVKESTLFKNRVTHVIPNPIDLSIFKPIEKRFARELLNLPQFSKLILFGALGATSDPRKGFVELNQALKVLDGTMVEIVVFGSGKPKVLPDLPFKINYIGKVNDDITLNIIYNACDVMVVPSIQENLSNAIMESLSCGTPVVAFNIGGNMDLIDHQINGYLANPNDIKDLSNGIQWVLQYQNYKQLCNNARMKIEGVFEQNIVVANYIQLYKSLVYDNLNIDVA